MPPARSYFLHVHVVFIPSFLLSSYLPQLHSSCIYFILPSFSFSLFCLAFFLYDVSFPPFFIFFRVYSFLLFTILPSFFTPSHVSLPFFLLTVFLFPFCVYSLPFFAFLFRFPLPPPQSLHFPCIFSILLPFHVYFPFFFLSSSTYFSLIHVSFFHFVCALFMRFPSSPLFHSLHFSLSPSLLSKFSLQPSIQTDDKTLARVVQFANAHCFSYSRKARHPIPKHVQTVALTHERFT